jgi:hypothetical protein
MFTWRLLWKYPGTWWVSLPSSVTKSSPAKQFIIRNEVNFVLFVVYRYRKKSELRPSFQLSDSFPKNCVRVMYFLIFLKHGRPYILLLGLFEIDDIWLKIFIFLKTVLVSIWYDVQTFLAITYIFTLVSKLFWTKISSLITILEQILHLGFLLCIEKMYKLSN